MVDAVLSLEQLASGTQIYLETSRGPLSAHLSKGQWELGCAAQSSDIQSGVSHVTVIGLKPRGSRACARVG